MSLHKNIKHTGRGLELLKILYEQGKRIFTLEDAKKYMKAARISKCYLVECLFHLTKTRWINHLKRGVYCISSSFPGMMPIHEFEIAMALVQPSAISHLSALHFHGMTDEIPRTVYLITPKMFVLSKPYRKKRNGHSYKIIKIKPERFFGIQNYWINEVKVVITDLERTLLDGLMMPKHCGGFSEVYHAFTSHLSKIDLEKIISYSLKLDVAVSKRLGWMLERLGMKEDFLKSLEHISVKGYRVLDSSSPKKGPYNKRWMIQENIYLT